jgi:hypothetical protein
VSLNLLRVAIQATRDNILQQTGIKDAAKMWLSSHTELQF